MPPSSPLAQTVNDLLSALAAPVFVLVLHILRVLFLTEYHELDMLMHFLGGASILVAGLVAGSRLRRRGLIPADLPPWLAAFALIGLVGLVGIAWEFFEFATDYAAQTQAQGGLKDTMADLALDLLGGMSALLVAPWFAQRMKK
ncbi:hypothetical protein EPO33_03160 [Patescibacteria group bacterium]|nr:MAG: hypothetical protein EPO33_03160 [Patescibacteria group bacterium]